MEIFLIVAADHRNYEHSDEFAVICAINTY